MPARGGVLQVGGILDPHAQLRLEKTEGGSQGAADKGEHSTWVAAAVTQ